MRNIIAAAFLAVATLQAMPAAHAGDKVEQVRSYIDTVGKDALAIISSGDAKEKKQAKLESLFEKTVDIPWVGKFALGRYWRTATDEQKKKYIKEYGDFLTSHYAGRFAEFSGGSYTITGATDDGEGEYTVNMQMRAADNKPPVEVAYRVHETNGQLRVFDVIVEGVSMITTQRSEFSSVVANKSLDYLIEKMASKTLAIADGTGKNG